DGVANLKAPGIESFNAQGPNIGNVGDLAAYEFRTIGGLSRTPPGYPNIAALRVEFQQWQGQNAATNEAKTTPNMIEAYGEYFGAGQRQLAYFYGAAPGYGDFQGISVMQMYGGGTNAAGDEGGQGLRLDVRGQDVNMVSRTVQAIVPGSNCNTTTLDP